MKNFLLRGLRLLGDDDVIIKAVMFLLFSTALVGLMMNKPDELYAVFILSSTALILGHIALNRLKNRKEEIDRRKYDVITDVLFWLIHNKEVKKPLLARRILVPEAVLEELKRIAQKDYHILHPAWEAWGRIKELEAQGELEIVKTKPTEERIRDERAQEPWRRSVIELIYQTQGKRKLAILDPILRREIERFHWRSGLEFIPTLPKEFQDTSGSKFERFLLTPVEERA